MEALNLPEVSGVLVAKVEIDSPAHKAGLSVGDVILEFNGEKVPNVSKFRIAVATSKVGTKVPVKIIREDKVKTLYIQLDNFPEDTVAETEEAAAPDSGAGISVEATDSAYAQRNNIKASKGVIVSAIESNSPASKAGIQVGFVVLKVGNTEVNSPEEYSAAMNAAIDKMRKDERNTIILYVQDRNKTEQFVVLRFN
ncbi:MAG TPA: PDZ domain-containing protein, partial [Candidatus Syntrophosphaera sp.]|nr:PDZ domain-containing protein [Candidatus Syntrophosphaera sp.]